MHLIHWIIAWADYHYRIAYWYEVEINEAFYRLLESALTRRDTPPPDAPAPRWRA